MQTALQNKTTISFAYSFLEQDGVTPLSLTGFDTVTLLLRPPAGIAPIQVAGTFVNQSGGTVTVAAYQIRQPGSSWLAQFVCSSGPYSLTNPTVLYGIESPLPDVETNLDD